MKKILIVDDEKSICQLLSHFLEGQGFSVTTTLDPLQGLDTVKAVQPDLVILDVNMPGMDGWQILQTLKSSPRTAGIPVIMCTGRDMIKDIETADAMGAAAYITKPFELERVLHKITAVLGMSS